MNQQTDFVSEVLTHHGYEIVENVYSLQEIKDILNALDQNAIEQKFGIREFLIDHPEIRELVFTKKLIQIIKSIAPDCNKCIKSIYFDKPPNANWIVNWHQDLTINLKEKKYIEGYKNWRVNSERVIVQPDRALLESIFTIRIHLDDCTRDNGALRVIEGSYAQGVIDIKDWMSHKTGVEHICEVPAGGILIMKPLTLHASRRTENQMNRRVLHLEFTDRALPEGLAWKEALAF